MDKKFICYCGLYCENCAVMAKVSPAAKTLHTEMKNAGFEDIIGMIPGGDGFWGFLKSLAEEGICISCKDGGGNPGCEVRLCAKEKNVEACALCNEYPCEKFDEFFKGYPILKTDNKILQKSLEEWAELQDERKKKGFTYTDK